MNRRTLLRALLGICILILPFLGGCDRKESGTGGSGQPTPSAQSPSPAGTVEILLVYGSEKQSWIDEVTAGFNSDHPRLTNGKTVHVSTKPMGSGESKDDLIAGRIQAHLWSPASGVFVKLGNSESEIKGGPLVGATKELVLSPVVIAMWKPMAEALGWPGKPIGWADVIALAKSTDGWASYGQKQFGRFKFGHTHPEYSNSGLISVLAEAYAGAGKVRDLALDDIKKPEVGQYMADIEQSVVHYGRSTGFFGKRLIEDGPQYLSAAVLYENMVVESYAKQTALPLVAIYPKEGTFWSDHPIGIVQRPWVTDEHKAAAELYISYLRAPAQQQKALQFGFRPAEGTVGAPIDAAHGVDPLQPLTTLEVPSASVISAIIDLWREHKKNANVALVFDKSGSMNELNKIVQAKKGAIELVKMLGPKDWLTIVPFSGDIVVMDPVPIDTGREQAIQKIDGLFANGGTRLYEAISEARTALQKRNDSTRIQAIVVLTDGENNGRNLSLDQLLAQINDGEEPERGVRVFTIGYGDSARLDDLKTISKRSHGEAYKGTTESIMAVFRDIATFF